MDINTTNADVVNISEGPLSYVYRAYEIKLRYANNDSKGSEHTINGNHFVGEVSIYFFPISLFSVKYNEIRLLTLILNGFILNIK